VAQDMCARWTSGRKLPLEFHTKNLGPNIFCVCIVLYIYAPCDGCPLIHAVSRNVYKLNAGKWTMEVPGLHWLVGP